MDNIILKMDNYSQYISKEFNNYLKTMGIKHEYIEKETPEENGDIESSTIQLRLITYGSMKSIIIMMVK